MLRNVKDLEGGRRHRRHVRPRQGFLFNHRACVVRYLVVEAGARLASRKVLVSPSLRAGSGRAPRKLATSAG